MKEFKEKNLENHILWRVINDHIVSYNFKNSNNAYAPHLVTLADGENYYISPEDQSVSIIDVKTSRMQKALYDNSALYKDWIDVWHKFYTAENIKNTNIDLVGLFNDKYKSNIKAIYPDTSKYEKSMSSEKKLSRIKKMKYLRKLFNDTQSYKDILREEKEWATLLNTTGRKYFSDIIGKFIHYNTDTNFLWKQWKSNLFPNNIFWSIRFKLDHWYNLTDDDIVNFIDYLLIKERIPENKKETEFAQETRHQRNMLRSHVINILYAMIFADQKYHYQEIQAISKWFKDSVFWIDNKISEKYQIKKEDIYTEWWLKWLPSIAFKELRGEEVKDMIRWRTRIADHILEDSTKRDEITKSIFESSVDNLKEYYCKQGYEVCVKDFEIVNKFKKWNIIFNQELVDRYNTSFKKGYNIPKKSDENIHPKNKNMRDYYKYDMSLVKSPYVEEKERNILDNALKNDNSKTGWNGSYADIKEKITFDLIKKDDPTKVIKDMSYEHMVVNMDSHNEWGLSDHNIFLDPIKTIPLKLKISSAIDINIFSDSVTGWIEKTIKELTLLKLYKENPENKPAHMSMKYIEKQLDIRNQIPQEILDIAWLLWPKTYLEIDQNHHEKQIIENAIVKYLLKDQLKKWRLHWFIYDNDHIDWLSDALKNNIKKWNALSYTYYGQDDFIEQALSDDNRWKYCFCGWWSNNFAKSCNSKLYSEKWYIGFADGDNIVFMGVADVTGIVGEGTVLKKEKVKVWSLESQLLIQDNKKSPPRNWVGDHN